MHDQQLTTLLDLARAGDVQARDDALERVYGEVRMLASHLLRRERRDHTLQPTALVHEAYLRILKGEEIPGQNRRQLLGFLAKAMRNILVDHARRRSSQKRGGDRERVDLNDNAIDLSKDAELVALDDALQELQAIDDRKSRVVELRYFGGFSVDETAEILDVSNPTVKRDWRIAKAWLFDRLSDEPA